MRWWWDGWIVMKRWMRKMSEVMMDRRMDGCMDEWIGG